MRSASLITYYLVPVILIGLSNEVPLDGKHVRDAKINELPFVVSLEEKGDKYSNFCVGTLISRQSVLTAAHCLLKYKYNQVNIVVGSIDRRRGKRYKVKSWINYDQWMNLTDESEFSMNDIAVITLAQKVKDANPAAVLTFARQDLDYSKVRIAGWGLSQDGVHPIVLKTAVLQVIPDDECISKMESLLENTFFILENDFCTLADPWVLGGCGDSGAPILNRQNQVVGIHRSVCPASITRYSYPEEFVNQNLVNTHLHLHLYRTFINDVKI